MSTINLLRIEASRDLENRSKVQFYYWPRGWPGLVLIYQHLIRTQIAAANINIAPRDWNRVLSGEGNNDFKMSESNNISISEGLTTAERSFGESS